MESEADWGQFWRNTNQTVAELGEEADMVVVPETSSFKVIPSTMSGIFKTLAPSCGVMRVLVSSFANQIWVQTKGTLWSLHGKV